MMSQMGGEAIDDDIRSIESSEWTLETASIGTIGDENARENESNLANALLLEAKAQLEELKEDEEKTKSRMQAIQGKIDESAKEMANRNAEHQKRKQEVEKKCQKEIAEMESKNMEENVNFAMEMTSLKEQLKEKINWNQVDLVMGKKLSNPFGNGWKAANAKVTISQNGLGATSKNKDGEGHYVFAEQHFCIQKDKFPGAKIFYYEVTKMASSPAKMGFCVGLSNGNMADGKSFCHYSNSYAIHDGYDHCWLSEQTYQFEWPNGAIKRNDQGDVVGCGLLMSQQQDKVSIFFTQNGVLIGKEIAISPSVDCLFPTIYIWDAPVEANFGDDLAKPFKYNTGTCPGLEFE